MYLSSCRFQKPCNWMHLKSLCNHRSFSSFKTLHERFVSALLHLQVNLSCLAHSQFSQTLFIIIYDVVLTAFLIILSTWLYYYFDWCICTYGSRFMGTFIHTLYQVLFKWSGKPKHCEESSMLRITITATLAIKSIYSIYVEWFDYQANAVTTHRMYIRTNHFCNMHGLYQESNYMPIFTISLQIICQSLLKVQMRTLIQY